MLLVLVAVTLTSTVWGSVRFGVANINDKHFCVGYRTEAWTRREFELADKGVKYRLKYCNNRASSGGYSIGDVVDHVPATLVDANCNISNITPDKTLFVKAPFTPELLARLNNSKFSTVLQVRGDIGAELAAATTVVITPVVFNRIYWGAIIMYFYTLIFIAIGAIVVESGRAIVARHAEKSPLHKIQLLQTRLCLVLFLVSFFTVLTVIFSGYLIQPLAFQCTFAVFIALIGVVGLYHLIFPFIVFIAIKHIRIVNKTYWAIERTSVFVTGIVIFGVWVVYRAVPNIWPLQMLLLSCIAAVPLRYAPVNCILKLVMFTIIGVFFSVLQTFILPAATGRAPAYVDIVSVQARIPDTISPGPIFLSDLIEGNMFGFRIPLFDSGTPCSGVLDSTFGSSGFILPCLFIKAAMIMDTTINDNSIKITNYTVSVIAYLCSHITVFILSYVRETPVNGCLFYLPGILIAVILNNLRLGTLGQVMGPPPDPQQQAASTRAGGNNNMVLYKVSSGGAGDYESGCRT